MQMAIDTSRYYLVVDGESDSAIFVFLGSDTGLNGVGAPGAVPVTLELLPPRQRFGGLGGVAMGRPVLGRWPGGFGRFRQFLTVSELEQAGWVPVGQYRICDCWQDYHTPWSFLSDDESTGHGSNGRADTAPR